MLQYLRENKFMNDTDYYKFMGHVRDEKRSADIDVSPKELKKREKKGKNDEDK